MECQSNCGSEPTSYEWLQTIGADGENSTLESKDFQIVVESVDYKDGGVYKCRCIPDGPLCEQSVYSKCPNPAGLWMHGKLIDVCHVD